MIIIKKNDSNAKSKIQNFNRNYSDLGFWDLAFAIWILINSSYYHIFCIINEKHLILHFNFFIMEKKKGVEQLFDIPIFNPETKGKLEELYENNKKTIMYFLSFVAIALIGYFGYKGLIIKPKEKEARGLIFMAENYFQADSFQKALSGHPPSVYGFLDIIDEFGQTPTGNLAKYYAGLCYLHLGKYDDAS